MPIRRPLSPGGGWVEVSLYREYADLARAHLIARRYFEAIIVSCVGYDVLMNTLLDRIRLRHDDKLTPEQRNKIGGIKDRLPAGKILDKLEEAEVIHSRLIRALRKFNKERNNVIHPLEIRKKADPNGNTSHSLSLKQEAVVPLNATKGDAERYYRLFCHIIDLPGGESPRSQEKELLAYLRERKKGRGKVS